MVNSRTEVTCVANCVLGYTISGQVLMRWLPLVMYGLVAAQELWG